MFGLSIKNKQHWPPKSIQRKSCFFFFLNPSKDDQQMLIWGDWDNQDFERDIGVVFSHDKSGLA